ncbi:MAG: glycosyltransferase family 87 protein [Solirubrobacteraceae bacterium]
MARAPAHPEQARVASSTVPTTGSGEGTFALPRALPLGKIAIPGTLSLRGRLTGLIALGSLIAGALLLVAFSSAGPSALVSRSLDVFPSWEAGPWHALFNGISTNNLTVTRYGFSFLVVAMMLAYLVVLVAARALSLRSIVICIVALHAILLLGPAVQSNDLFTYLGYSRLGGLHGFNPYSHVIAQEMYDPVYAFSGWRHLSSPYGPLFTAATYLVAWVPLSVAFWSMKIVTALASLGVLWLVYKCARALGRDPRLALAFVALNPVYLVWALGGFHNDFLMLLPSMAAILLVLKGRDRSAGAVLMLAVAIKFSTLLLLPFLVVAAWPARSRVKSILIGAALGAIPLIALSIGLFGVAHPNLQYQTTLLNNFSVPNVVGDVIGAGGGAPWLLHLADVVLVAVVVLLLRAKGDWISRAGWATFALILSLAWLMPWYLIWLTPLAALGASDRLRKVTLGLTVYLVLCFVPITDIVLSQHGLDPMNTKVGQQSQTLQDTLQK